MAINKVMVVDDSATERHVLGDILSKKGFLVVYAESGEKAVESSKTELPDLILMDLGLPGMDGLEATRALKNGAATCRVPVIALTAHAMRGDKDVAAAAGCDGYLTKPLNTRTFATTIGQFISSAHLGASSPADNQPIA